PEQQKCPCGTPHPVVTRYDGWLNGSATPRYSVELPDPRRTDTQPDDFGWRMTDPACGCADWGYRSFEIAGDLFFAGELAGPVHVHEGTTGIEVNLIFRMPPPPPSTWTPAGVAPAAWYVANNVDQTAGAVTTWFDQSGNNRHLVAYSNPSGRPTLQPSGLSGKPTITFNGGQLLHSDHWSVAPTGSNSAFTVMAVVQPTAPQNAGIVSWWSSGGSVWADLKASGTRTLADLTRLDANNGGQMYTAAQDLGAL